MKYQAGQTVQLLDTSFKPVTSGVIRELNAEIFEYYVENTYPGSSTPEYVWIPQERLILQADIVNAAE